MSRPAGLTRKEIAVLLNRKRSDDYPIDSDWLFQLEIDNKKLAKALWEVRNQLYAVIGITKDFDLTSEERAIVAKAKGFTR